jgi:2-polyprenyl-3-methyl-5-hydroxy-6-metoxy-1,4-benzoquinol methylase
MELPITPEVVKWGYRLFLDREPEDESVIQEKIENHKSIEDLRRTFMISEEFRQKNAVFPTLSGHEAPMIVDLTASESVVEEIFAHIQSSWVSLGEHDPYFSVLTEGRFWQSRITKQRIHEFYESGREEVARLFQTLARNSIESTALRTCLDYGCGACRISRWLAEEFETVYAYDVSKKHLDISKKYLKKQNVVNVQYHQLKRLGDLANLPKVDLIYCVIVLQHNPPPVIGWTIMQFMKALKPGGIAFFQVPTYREGYCFVADEYLEDVPPEGEIEMHVLPQSEIFKIVRNEGCELLEVLEDLSASWGLSNTFLVQKK